MTIQQSFAVACFATSAIAYVAIAPSRSRRRDRASFARLARLARPLVRRASLCRRRAFA
jgi:hypothetical protein